MGFGVIVEVVGFVFWTCSGSGSHREWWWWPSTGVDIVVAVFCK